MTANNMEKIKLLYVGTDIESLSSINNSEKFDIINQENSIKAKLYLKENQNQIDAILTNAFLLGTTGLDFFDNIRYKSYLATDKPFLLFSKSYKHSLNNKAYKIGIDDYFTYPLNPEHLHKRLLFLKNYKKYNIENAESKTENLKPYKTPFIKRLFDVTLASLALIFLSPLMLITAIAIYIESRGKVFYASKRVGKNFKTFDFYKFRSMYPDADKRLKEVAHLNQYQSVAVEEECSECAKLPEGEYCSPVYENDKGEKVCERIIKMQKNAKAAFLKIENDPRITKVGKIIRNTSIDELPQLINIIKGDMSIVGNRPLPVGEANALTKSEMGKRLELGLRFNCAAGLTGLWQVELRGKAGEMSEQERFELDKKYAQKNSFWGDIKLIFRTFKVFLKNENV